MIQALIQNHLNLKTMMTWNTYKSQAQLLKSPHPEIANLTSQVIPAILLIAPAPKKLQQSADNLTKGLGGMRITKSPALLMQEISK